MEISRTLYIWAKDCDQRQMQLSEWLDTAIENLADQGGQSLANTSANGVMVSFMSNGMTLTSWINALSRAIQMIDNPKLASTRTISVFR